MLFVLNQRRLRHYKLYQEASSLSHCPDIWKTEDPKWSHLRIFQLSFFNCCISVFWNRSFSWKYISFSQIKICSSTVGFVVSRSWMNTLFTEKIRDWIQVSVSFIQSKDYSGNATAQATVSLTTTSGYFDLPFSFWNLKKITKLETILFSIHLPSIWTPDKPKDSPFHPGCRSRASSHWPGRWVGRLHSQGCCLHAVQVVLKRLAEEESLITESAEEQSGVRPLCL